jgi:hypothetical protein
VNLNVQDPPTGNYQYDFDTIFYRNECTMWFLVTYWCPTGSYCYEVNREYLGCW